MPSYLYLDDEHLFSLLDIHHRNLAILEKQFASFGANYVPPHIKNQLEEEIKTIETITAELSRRGKLDTSRLLFNSDLPTTVVNQENINVEDTYNIQNEPNSYNVVIESAHTGKRYNFSVTPHMSIKFLISRALKKMNLTEYADTGAFIPFKIRWILVDIKAESKWHKLKRSKRNQLRAIVRSKKGIIYSFSEQDSLEKAKISKDIIFHLYAIEDKETSFAARPTEKYDEVKFPSEIIQKLQILITEYNIRRGNINPFIERFTQIRVTVDMYMVISAALNLRHPGFCIIFGEIRNLDGEWPEQSGIIVELKCDKALLEVQTTDAFGCVLFPDINIEDLPRLSFQISPP